MKTTNKAVYKIAPPKIKLTTKGYINLIARNRAETTKKGVKMYRSKITLNVAKFILKSKNQVNKLLSQSFVQVGIFEAKIQEAKNALKQAKKQYLSTLEYFNLHVNLAKAILHTKNFRYSLPSYISSLLF